MRIPAGTGAQRIVRESRKAGRAEWELFWHSRPLREHDVLYESFAGNGVLDNPEAIFRGLLADPRYEHLHHIWVLDDPGAHPDVVAEFARNPRVRFVRRGSPHYSRALATAKYLVNNATFPAEFSKRDGQVYVNTWHGTPLKTMGYDEPEGGRGSRNVLRNLLAADYLLASCPFMAEMYESAYRLRNLAQGEIVTEGAPRVDRQFLDAAGRTAARAGLRDAGLPVTDDARIVLYAPTWRGESFHSPTNDVAALAARVRSLRERLPDDHVVLLKVHQQAFQHARLEPDLADLLVPNDVPTNVVLGVTDVLVNDYSSIFFDFLSTGRPIIFFTPDGDHYRGTRGLYPAPAETLPGPTVTRVDDLARLVRAVGTNGTDDPLTTHAANYARARELFASKDDGRATSRVIDVVFGGEREGLDVRPVSSDGRRRLLLYLGGMKSNGITSAALSLLDNIDHDRYDVTAFYVHSNDPDRRKNEALINPRVRLVPRTGGMTPSKLHRRDH